MTNDYLSKAKVLIVDDEPANVRLLERILALAGCHHVRCTTDSRQALALFLEVEPDIVLLDLNMPHLNGFAVLEQLKAAIPLDDYLPILILTADITVETKRKALTSGAKDFLTKPLDHTEVVLRDETVPEPVRDLESPFLMPVENVLTITGRGTVVTGAIERGTLRVGEQVEVTGLGESFTAVCTGIETFGRTMAAGQAGDNAALLLRGVQRTQVRRGQVVAAPGSVRPHTRFRAEVYVLSAAEGGRHTGFGDGYRPQFHFRTTDVVGGVEVGGAVALPGDTVEVTVELGQPVAMDAGLGFAIREGGKTVGAGTVKELL